MTDSLNQDSNKGKKPTHIIYSNTTINGVQKLIRVGAAWKHIKGNGLNISLDSLVAFENKPKPENNEFKGGQND